MILSYPSTEVFSGHRLVFNSIQDSVTSYDVNESKGSLWISFQTAPVLHFLLGSFSLGLYDLQSYISPLLLAQKIPEQYCISSCETLLKTPFV